MRETDASGKLTSDRVRTVQIIVGAMLAGILIFLCIALILVQLRGRGLSPLEGMPVISYAAVGFLAVELVAWRIVPAHLADNQVAKIARGTWTPGPGTAATAFPTDTARLLAVFQTESVIANALLEAGGFLGCVAYLFEGQLFALAGVVVAVWVMLTTFPTRDKVAQWLDKQQARIREIRQPGDLSARLY